MTYKARAIGSHVKLGVDYLRSAKKAGMKDRNTPQLLFYAAENLTMAVLTSEDIDLGELRQKTGNHQLDSMIDALPADSMVRDNLLDIAPLMAFATTYRYPSPSGFLPKPPKSSDVQSWFSTLFEIANQLTRHFEIPIKEDAPVAGKPEAPKTSGSSVEDGPP